MRADLLASRAGRPQAHNGPSEPILCLFLLKPQDCPFPSHLTKLRGRHEGLWVPQSLHVVGKAGLPSERPELSPGTLGQHPAHKPTPTCLANSWVEL